jgi:hypothetical protein
MSHLYSVYEHPQRGRWGFTALTAEGDVKSAFVAAQDQQVVLKAMQPLQVAPAIARLVRSGYTKLAQMQYLYVRDSGGRQLGEFGIKHPDLVKLQDGESIFFTTLPAIDMGLVVEQWRAQLDNTNGACGPARERWLKHCAGATAYGPAPSTDVGAALVVAQWARENKQVLVASKGDVPAGEPRLARHDWRVFLQQWFTSEVIDTAFSQLGWSLSEALEVPARAATSICPDGGDSWIEIASQAGF